MIDAHDVISSITSACIRWHDGIRVLLVNSFQAIVPYMGQEKGVLFFTGVYLPQKLVLSPPIESQYKPFQKHVSSY
jgi:hypothetical protein